MTIELNHTIVPARDKEESARFYERMFGFEYTGAMGHFTPVRIQSQSLTLDFDENDSFEPGHFAFKVSEAEFDEIFARIVAAGLRLRQRAVLARGQADQPLERRARRLLPRPERPSARAAHARLHAGDGIVLGQPGRRGRLR